jgi:threonyl-tRNA synthetase
MSNDKAQDQLETIRHSCAHLMAQAVQELFPGTQVTIGPVIEDGFYYDFSRDKAFVPEDLEKIEKRMKELAAADTPIVRTEMPRDEAIKKFSDMGEKFKVEIIDSIDSSEPLSIYSQGDWSDLCRGPHVESTKQIKAFKLLHTSATHLRHRLEYGKRIACLHQTLGRSEETRSP